MKMSEAHQENKAQRLTDAFELFNQLSENLAQSYQGLESQVARLTEELAAARNERLKTLLEKEKITLRLQQILAALPAGVVILDDSGKVIDCNHQAIDFLGEPLIGLEWERIMTDCLLPVAGCPHERKLADGRRVNLVFNALDNESGQIVLLSDISELRSLQDLLAQQKQLSAMGEMVASMAHQVRTPLSTAILYASQLSKPALTEQQRQVFGGKILERLQYLERQVNDMLVFARQGKMVMDIFSLQHLLTQIKEYMDEQTAIQFDLNIQIQNDLIHGNEDALLGALMNLINNAIEVGQDGCRIQLSVVQQQGDIKFILKDNGPGIAREQLPRIFEPFYTTKQAGTGLGLAVVDSVIKAHGGMIHCHSKPGQGAVFTLTLPCGYTQTTTLSGSQTKQGEYA